jgi:hypothetical protein
LGIKVLVIVQVIVLPESAAPIVNWLPVNEPPPLQLNPAVYPAGPVSVSPLRQTSCRL